MKKSKPMRQVSHASDIQLIAAIRRVAGVANVSLTTSQNFLHTSYKLLDLHPNSLLDCIAYAFRLALPYLRNFA
jgi:hypothetical protein